VVCMQLPKRGQPKSRVTRACLFWLHRRSFALAFSVSLLCQPGSRTLLDHLVGAGEQRPWHFEAERFRSLEVDT
jgi:hypothetical protein